MMTVTSTANLALRIVFSRAPRALRYRSGLVGGVCSVRVLQQNERSICFLSANLGRESSHVKSSRCHTANAFVERLIATLRRECLDWIIPPARTISGSPFANGLRTTTAAVLIRRSHRDSLIRRRNCRLLSIPTGIASPQARASLPPRSSADFITTIGS
jgi:hypothetical protein